MRIWAALLACALASGCGDKPAQKADDELTIVVQADRTRLEGEQAALADQRKNLEQDRVLLRKQLEKLGEGGAAPTAELEQLRKSMLSYMEQQADVVQKSQAVVKQSDELVRKMLGTPQAPAATAAKPEAAPAAANAELARLTGQVASREKEMAGREKTLAERERELAEREKALAAREAGLAAREAGTAKGLSPKDKGLTASRPAVERAYKSLTSSMETKGVLLADLPPAKQKLVQDAGAARAGGDLAKAIDAIEAAQSAVDQVAIDGDFIADKVKRVNAVTQKKASDPKKKEQVSKLLPEITRAYSDGRFVEANRALNNLLMLLEK